MAIEALPSLFAGRPWARYLLAAGLFLVLLVVRFVVLPVEAGLAYLTFYPGVALTVLLLGVGPTVLFVGLATTVGTYIFAPPFWQFAGSTTKIIAPTTFLLSALAVLLTVRFVNLWMLSRTTVLRERERELNEAQRLARIGSWYWDPSTDVTTGSDELLRIYGFDPSTDAMPNFREQRGRCYPVDEWERLNAAVQETVGTGIGYTLDVRAIRNSAAIWVRTRSEVVRDAAGRTVGLRGTVQDITEVKQAELDIREARDELERRVAERTSELTATNAALTAEIEERRRIGQILMQEKAQQQALIEKLEAAQNQLLQSEKMASIGQLAAGVAHEINNPLGFISSNVGTLKGYVRDLLDVLAAYERCTDLLLPAHPDDFTEVSAAKARADFDYLREDLPTLLEETLDGIERVKKIVQDLKQFSRASETEWQSADLHQGLDSTLNVVWNELKYKAMVVKAYGEIPPVECLASQINQVFMNLLVNAAQAIRTAGTITLRTGQAGDFVWVEVADTGDGIAPENLKRIFEPFFTTKPVGQGTGLGLSVSYGIIRRHGGRIDVESEPGKGSRFRVWLPIRQEPERAEATA